MWAERNRVRPRRDEEPKPSRWWRSRWSVALPASKARNRFLGLGFGGRPQRGGQQPARISPSQSPARQSGNERWLARVPGAGAARLSAYRHARAQKSGGRSSTLSLDAHYPVQPEALSPGHAPQSRIATPPTLRGRIQLPAQPPHYGGQSVSAPGAGLSHNQHCHLQGFNRRAGSSLIFIKINFQHLLPDLALQLCHPIRLRPLVSRAHKGACPQLLLSVIPAVHLARTYLQLPCQPRHWLPRLHAPHRRQLKFPGKPPFRHTNPPSLNSIGELVVSKLGSTPFAGLSLCLDSPFED